MSEVRDIQWATLRAGDSGRPASRARARLLQAVASEPYSHTAELGREADISPETTRAHLSRMRALGWVARSEPGKDRRVRWACTDEGWRVAVLAGLVRG